MRARDHGGVAMKAWLVFLLGLVAGVVLLAAVQDLSSPARATIPAPAPTPMIATVTVADGRVSSGNPVGELAVAGVTSVARPEVTVADTTRAGDLLIPVQGTAASALSDTFTDARGQGRVHDAIDIMAPRGTPVLATQDGPVAKLFSSVRGGLTLYQFDARREHAYYYAHLDRYAPDMHEGRVLKRGEVLGYVGSTGNASPDAPHLHFAIMALGPKDTWWQGTAINPYPLLTTGD